MKYAILFLDEMTKINTPLFFVQNAKEGYVIWFLYRGVLVQSLIFG